MQRIKLVAIDLDDTLLRDDLTISSYSQEVIQKVREAGVAVTLATGRMFPSAFAYAEQLGFEMPLITYQGALIKNAFSGEVIYCCPLQREAAQLVIEYGRKHKLHINFYLDDKLYVERITPQGEHYERHVGVPFTKVDDLEELLAAGLPYKLLLIDDEERLPEHKLQLQELFAAEGLDVYLAKSKPTYLEVNDPQATKGNALRKLADRLGVQREEVMACGDSFNDLDMLEYAGIGVAVANAYPEVRARARYVTASNNDDGVALALVKFIKLSSIAEDDLR
jgi:Cof subfamily protein (haloacid dehalogenase superfamily)